ncbi:polysaccharide deacetylase family protein [Motilimonas cestriensis]|uniref:polysaccharide deacetylase family protein n=1 Tax=Motilimonas cestriensis TaxID=2742685 RepID=UPI003DA4A682
MINPLFAANLLDRPRKIVLMYHSVPTLSQQATQYDSTLAQFKQHLALLAQLNSQVVTLNTLMTTRDSQGLQIAITFDDGYLDNLTNALPALTEYQFPATLFMVTRAAPAVSQWSPNPKPLLSPQQLQQLDEQGWEIGGHTCHHLDLTRLSASQSQQQINNCKDDLEQQLGKAVNSFAYPFGRYQLHHEEQLAAAGFEYACTTRAGAVQPHTQPLTIPRITVFANDCAPTLLRKLTFISNKMSWFDVAGYYASRILKTKVAS